MAEKTKTYWTKDPEEEPLYSDWNISFVRKGENENGDDDGKGDNGMGCTIGGTVTSSSQKNFKSSMLANDTVVTYSVHRNMVGPRSEYFTTIFCQSLSNDRIDNSQDNGINSMGVSFVESRNQQSRIEFSGILSKRSFNLILTAFEAFLDFCYFDDPIKRKRFDDDDDGSLSPVALHFICDYFQIRSDEFLRRVRMYTETKTKYLCTKSAALNVESERSEEYFCNLCDDIINFRSEGLNTNAIQNTFVLCCYANKQWLSPGRRLSTIINVALWLAIASSTGETNYNKDDSNNWSNNVASFIESNRESIDNDSFGILTNKTFLPTIDANAAVILLKEENLKGLYECCVMNHNKDVLTTAGTHNDSAMSNNSDDDRDVVISLTSLQERCVDSFVSAHLEVEGKEKLHKKAIAGMSRKVMGVYLKKNTSRMSQAISEKKREIDRITKSNNERIQQIAKENRAAINQLETAKMKLYYRNLAFRKALETQILDIMSSFENKNCEVSFENVVTMLPDVPISEIEGAIGTLVSGTPRIKWNYIEECYTVCKYDANDRALQLLKMHQNRDKKRSNEELLREQCYDVLSPMMLDKVEMDRILDKLTITNGTDMKLGKKKLKDKNRHRGMYY